MNQETICKFRMMDDLGVHSHEHLYMLYRPLMGSNSCELYEVLCAIAAHKSEMKLEDLLSVTGINEGFLTQGRRKLEQFLLLSTYSSEDESVLEFHIYPPKTPKDFLRHEIFSRMMIQKFPSERFEQLKDLFDLEEKESKLKNISESMSSMALEQEWDESKETVLQMHMPPDQDANRYPFDWEIFFKRMDRTIPSRLRTKQNLNEIAYLAHIYGLDELEIRKYVVRGIRDGKSYIDFDYVVSSLQKTRKLKQADNDPMKASPILYLRSLQPAQAAILPNERALLEELSAKYQFPDEVINTLIEYCLKECNQAFVENYIRKVANTWVRLKISTRQQALAQISSSQPKNTVQKEESKQLLPDWYSKTETKPVSDELYNRIMERRKQRKGE